MSVNTELENKVLDYCNAAANLYYCIPVKKLAEIYNSQNDPLTLTEFCGILDSLLSRKQFFDIFSKSEIEDGIEDDKTPTAEKELLAENLYSLGDFEDYFKLQSLAFGHPFYVPEKERFLKYADEFYAEKTPEFISFRAYFRNIPSLSKEEADDLANESVLTLRLFNRDPSYIFDRMEQLKIAPKSQAERDRLTDLIIAVGRSIRLPCFRGATAEEADMM